MEIIFCSGDNYSLVKLIFDIITALGVLLAAIGIFLNKRAEHASIINKCTQEFRDIVRRENAVKKEERLPAEVSRDDYLGLFNEQFFYIGKSYLPKDIAKEWLFTIYAFVVEDEEGRFFCKTSWFRDKKIFECNCPQHKNLECFQRVKEFYVLCNIYKEEKETEVSEKNRDIKTDIYNTYYRFPFSKRQRRRALYKKKTPERILIKKWLCVERIWNKLLML